MANMIKTLDYKFDSLKGLRQPQDPKKTLKKTTVVLKKNSYKTLKQNYYVKQNILTRMIELILNQRMTKFQLIINDRV